MKIEKIINHWTQLNNRKWRGILNLCRTGEETLELTQQLLTFGHYICTFANDVRRIVRFGNAPEYVYFYNILCCTFSSQLTFARKFSCMARRCLAGDRWAIDTHSGEDDQTKNEVRQPCLLHNTSSSFLGNVGNNVRLLVVQSMWMGDLDLLSFYTMGISWEKKSFIKQWPWINFLNAIWNVIALRNNRSLHMSCFLIYQAKTRLCFSISVYFMILSFESRTTRSTR